MRTGLTSCRHRLARLASVADMLTSPYHFWADIKPAPEYQLMQNCQVQLAPRRRYSGILALQMIHGLSTGWLLGNEQSIGGADQDRRSSITTTSGEEREKLHRREITCKGLDLEIWGKVLFQLGNSAHIEISQNPVRRQHHQTRVLEVA